MTLVTLDGTEVRREVWAVPRCGSTRLWPGSISHGPQSLGERERGGGGGG